MCLDTITERYDPPLKGVIGYKVVRMEKGQWLSTDAYKRYEKGKRYRAVPFKLTKGSRSYGVALSDDYTKGFHAYKSKHDARAYWHPEDKPSAVIKVRLDGVRLCGSNNDGVCYVADYLTVLNEVRSLRGRPRL